VPAWIDLDDFKTTKNAYRQTYSLALSGDKMPYTTEHKPQRLASSNLVLEQLPDELMIYDQKRNKAYCLNQTAAFVWQNADGNKTVSDLVELMTRELKKPVNEQVIWFALDVLSKDGLLEGPTAVTEVPAGVSRRALLQKVGMGVAVAIPAVTVLLVSPAKAHASSGGPCKSSNWLNC